MLEIPESFNMAEQLKKSIKDKVIKNVIANSSPHKFAFYNGDPADYSSLLAGETIRESKAIAGFVEVTAGDTRMLFSDGVNIRYYDSEKNVPVKHQLKIEFTDGSSIICTISMYGGLWAYSGDEMENEYFIAAKSRPSPLTQKFDWQYFNDLISESKKSLSVKAFLATEQRIPGLGNGVLQDILFNAGIHPKSTLEKLSDQDKTKLFSSIKKTIQEMTEKGGRNTEKDLFGNNGGYEMQMSNKTLGQPCPACGGAIMREAYMGGNVYYCPTCQPLKK